LHKTLHHSAFFHALATINAQIGALARLSTSYYKTMLGNYPVPYHRPAETNGDL